MLIALLFDETTVGDAGLGTCRFWFAGGFWSLGDKSLGGSFAKVVGGYSFNLPISYSLIAYSRKLSLYILWISPLLELE